MLEIRTATTDDEREAIHRFRYGIYVEEMGRYLRTADHARRRLVDPEDERSWHAYAFDTAAGEVVAATRVTWGGDGFSSRQITQYSLAPFLVEVPAERMAVGERTMIAPAWRGADLFPTLADGLTGLIGAHDVRIVFGACEPHLISFYSRFQRPYASRNINSPEAGYLVPLITFLPGPEALAEFGVDGRLPRGVEQATTGTGAVTSPELEDPVGYAARVTEEVMALPASVFDGLSVEEVTHCVARSNVIACAEGDRVLRRGGSARNVFVVLSGALEVSDGAHVVGAALPGEAVGEMAYLLRQPRSYDVDVLDDGTRLLSLSERTMQNLLQEAPTAAAKLYANVARLVCTRLADRP